MKTLRYAAALLMTLSCFACAQPNPAPSPGSDQRPAITGTITANADTDTSRAPDPCAAVSVHDAPAETATGKTVTNPMIPPGCAESDPAKRGLTTSLRSDQIRTRHIQDGTATAGKLGYKAVTVTINAAAATGSSAADTTLAGGVLFNCTPNGNQDQLLDNAILNADGSITLTLAANATATNTFRCIAMKPNAKGTS